MSKPTFYLVWVDGVSRRFTQRRTARIFAASARILGKKVIFKPVGF